MVLPLPFGPITAQRSPLLTCQLTPLRTGVASRSRSTSAKRSAGDEALALVGCHGDPGKASARAQRDALAGSRGLLARPGGPIQRGRLGRRLLSDRASSRFMPFHCFRRRAASGVSRRCPAFPGVSQCVNGFGLVAPRDGRPTPRYPTHAWLSVGSYTWWDATMDGCQAC